MTKNSNDATIVMPIKDIEIIKADYLKDCFYSAQKNLDNDMIIDGEKFLKNL